MDELTRSQVNYRFIAEDRRRLEAWGRFIAAIRTAHYSLIPEWQQTVAQILNLIYRCWRWFTRQWTNDNRYFWPIAIILSGYAGIIYSLYAVFGEKLQPFHELPIKNWDDRRSLGFVIAGLSAPPLAAIGYFLSSRRTRAMQEGNAVQRGMQTSTLFIETQKLIDENKMAAVGGISVLARLGTENDDLREACKRQLIGYLETFAIKNEAGQRPNGDQFLLQIEAALNGLCLIQNQMDIQSDDDRVVANIDLVNLDFSNVRLPDYTRMRAFAFRSCCFSKATLNNMDFEKTHFLNCDFSDASLSHGKFHGGPFFYDGGLDGSDFTNADISGTDFSGIRRFTAEQFARCRYFIHAPPKGMFGWQDPPNRSSADIDLCHSPEMTLPPPWHTDHFNDPGRYLKKEKAEHNWKIYRKPSDRDGKPIKIVFPNETPEDKGEPSPPDVKDD